MEKYDDDFKLLKMTLRHYAMNTANLAQLLNQRIAYNTITPKQFTALVKCRKLLRENSQKLNDAIDCLYSVDELIAETGFTH